MKVNISMNLASLYIPVLEFLQMIFRGHKHMASILLKEVPEILLNIMQEISTHLKYGYESLMTHESSHESSERRSRSQGSTDSMECLYSKKEAKSIAEFSAKFIKCAIESDKDVLLFVVLECPMLTVRFNIFSQSFLFDFLNFCRNLCQNPPPL